MRCVRFFLISFSHIGNLINYYAPKVCISACQYACIRYTNACICWCAYVDCVRNNKSHTTRPLVLRIYLYVSTWCNFIAESMLYCCFCVTRSSAYSIPAGTPHSYAPLRRFHHIQRVTYFTLSTLFNDPEQSAAATALFSVANTSVLGHSFFLHTTTHGHHTHTYICIYIVECMAVWALRSCWSRSDDNNVALCCVASKHFLRYAAPPIYSSCAIYKSHRYARHMLHKTRVHVSEQL